MSSEGENIGSRSGLSAAPRFPTEVSEANGRKIVRLREETVTHTAAGIRWRQFRLRGMMHSSGASGWIGFSCTCGISMRETGLVSHHSLRIPKLRMLLSTARPFTKLLLLFPKTVWRIRHQSATVMPRRVNCFTPFSFCSMFSVCITAPDRLWRVCSSFLMM